MTVAKGIFESFNELVLKLPPILLNQYFEIENQDQ